ncbi:MAG TPA: tetratricopeptide repeat protein [Opitutaceae bacterium]|nr:tetratricopeptide repeat protein [Opitutaceae bacterium]
MSPSNRNPFTEATVAKLIRHGVDAERRGDVAEALNYFRQADSARPDDAFILQKISKQLSDSTDDLTDPKQQLELARQAMDYSKRAVALEPKSAVNLVSLAVCYGHIARWGATGERVEASRLVKKFAEQALAIDPNYAWAHHVLGRWNEEVADVGGPTRALAGLFYGGLPSGSIEEAIAQLKKAIALDPTSASHHIALGFVYWNSGDKTNARAELEKGLTLPPHEKHDLTLQRRTRELLKK